jgi:hypothetical protein
MAKKLKARRIEAKILKPTVVATLNQGRVRKVLADMHFSEDQIETAIDRLELLLPEIQAARVQSPRAKPRTQRKQFSKAAVKLEAAAATLEALDTPRKLHLQNRKRAFFEYETGLEDVRRALAPRILKVMERDFLRRFDIDLPPEREFAWDPRDIRNRERSHNLMREVARPDPDYIHHMVRLEGAGIAATILREIAAGFREAVAKIAEKTPGGGRRGDAIRDWVSINLVNLWVDCQGPQARMYSDEKYPEFGVFCAELGDLLGEPSAGSERHVKAAVKRRTKRFRT